MAEKLTRPREVLTNVLDRLIARGSDLRDGVGADNVDEMIASFRNWDSDARTLLQEAFTGTEPWQGYPQSFNKSYYLGGRSQEVNARRIRGGIVDRLQALASLCDLLPLYDVSPSVPNVNHGREMNAGDSIFVVHGRSYLRRSVKDFLQSATSAHVIFLDEQSVGSSVIIERLEEFADTAAFAIVLMTGDDYGGLFGEAPQKRARQNVIFELGLFMGAWGRSRVAILYEEGVERPSDIGGVLYTSLDQAGAWKGELGKKLEAAGFAVDLNKG